MNFNDPRVLFTCHDPPYKLEKLVCYSDYYEDYIDIQVEEFCNVSVCLNLATDELLLPNLFKTY